LSTGSGICKSIDRSLGDSSSPHPDPDSPHATTQQSLIAASARRLQDLRAFQLQALFKATCSFIFPRLIDKS
jgi:hypothetical protein